MRYSEQLKADHEDIRTMLAILIEVSNRFEEGKNVPPQDLEKILRFLDVFVTRMHDTKEEQLLYPALEEAGLQRDGGPIAVMLAEHQISQNFLSGMRDAMERYAGGDKASGPIAAEYARNYAALLGKHLEQEDEVIFPVADSQLPKERQEALEKQFDEVEKAVIGPKHHEEFHHLARELAESYLN